MKAINEEFEYKSVFLRIVEKESCEGCCFDSLGYSGCNASSDLDPCRSPRREDKKDIIFLKIDNPKKGQKNGQCAQKDCKNQGANYWHRMNKEYFCETCAEIIAELMAEDIALVCSDGKLLVMEA